MANSARIDELRKKFDENPRRYFAPLANEYRKAGDLEQAIFICQEYLPQQPGHMSGHIVHGQALYDLGRTDEAKVAFETALSLDPENLIALRHLGDIARQASDTDTARMWYQRVLETDPRNEEIAQIMISLLSTPEPGSVNPTAPTPIASAHPVPPPESWRSAVPSEASSSGDSSSALDVERSEEATVPEPVEASVTPTPMSTPVTSPSAEDFRRRFNEDELLDFDDASIGGLSLSDVAPNVQVEGPEPARDEPVGTPAEGVSEFSSMNLDERSETATDEPAALELGASFEADPFAIATPAASFDDSGDTDHAAVDDVATAAATLDASTTEPEVERATDITLGLPDDGLPTSESGAVEGATLDGLETFEPGFVGTPDTASSIAAESYFGDEEPTSSANDEAAGDVPAADVHEPEPLAWETSEEPAATRELSDTSTSEATQPESVDSVDQVESIPEDLEVEEFTVFETSAPTEVLPPLQTPVWSSIAVESLEVTLEPQTPPEPMANITSPLDEEVAETASAPESAPIDGGHDGREAPDTSIEFAESSTPSEPAPPFVTETMAELYLQQGHLEFAIDIYRQLVEQRPDDEALRARLRDVEDQLYRTPAAASDETSTPAAPTGPTIREFLLGVFARGGQASQEYVDVADANVESAQPMSLAEEATFEDPVMAEEAGLGHPETFEAVESPTELPDISSDFGEPRMAFDEPTASAGADESASQAASELPAPVSMPTPSAAGATVRGSIDALFSGADASTIDSGAASTLAEAFQPEPEEPTPPLHGIPAHRATDELSLDHVFKGNTPPRPSAEVDAFSFDQFFAENAEDSAAASNTPNAAEPDAGDDIAQFNAWLNGLKKS